MAKTGIALDLGTTNLAGFIIDLDKPKDRFAAQIKCSLAKHGRDLVTRLTFASSSEKLAVLQKLLVSDVNNLIQILSKRIKINRKRLDRLVVSGNTPMLHFLLGRDVSGLKAYPFSQQVKGSESIGASSIGITAGKDTKLITLPIVSAFVGGDAVAGVLYTGMSKLSSLKLLIDLGTNAELVLGSSKGLWGASAAAGPAFRGSELLLGSKMISKVAGMLRKGEIDRTGRVLSPDLKRSAPVCSEKEPTRLDRARRDLQRRDISITQQDVRNLQLAKAAIRAGVDILLEKAGKRIGDVRKILLSGLFGEKIDIADAMEIGLVPKVERTKVRSIGNSSLGGAKLVLLKDGLLEKALSAAAAFDHVELSLQKNYQDLFLKNINFF